MPVAFVQEFAITDRSTKNYDSVKERLGGDPIDGLIFHTAGFDDDNDVFRIFDVWESREHADRFLECVMDDRRGHPPGGRNSSHPRELLRAARHGEALAPRAA